MCRCYTPWTGNFEPSFLEACHMHTVGVRSDVQWACAVMHDTVGRH